MNNKQINKRGETNFPCRRIPYTLADSPPSGRWSLTPHSLSVDLPRWLSSKEDSMKREERVTLKWRKLNPQAGAPVNIDGSKSSGQHIPWIGCDENGTLAPWVFLPQSRNFGLLMGKTSDKPSWRTVYQVTDPNSSRLWRGKKKQGKQEPVTAEQSYGDNTTK